jgi:hypothetical protein
LWPPGGPQHAVVRRAQGPPLRNVLPSILMTHVTGAAITQKIAFGRISGAMGRHKNDSITCRAARRCVFEDALRAGAARSMRDTAHAAHIGGWRQ